MSGWKEECWWPEPTERSEVVGRQRGRACTIRGPDLTLCSNPDPHSYLSSIEHTSIAVTP